MKIGQTEEGYALLKEVYNPIVLESNSGEILSVTMRDSGFEFIYQGKAYEAKEGKVNLLKSKPKKK